MGGRGSLRCAARLEAACTRMHAWPRPPLTLAPAPACSAAPQLGEMWSGPKVEDTEYARVKGMLGSLGLSVSAGGRRRHVPIRAAWVCVRALQWQRREAMPLSFPGLSLRARSRAPARCCSTPPTAAAIREERAERAAERRHDRAVGQRLAAGGQDPARTAAHDPGAHRPGGCWRGWRGPGGQEGGGGRCMGAPCIPSASSSTEPCPCPCPCPLLPCSIATSCAPPCPSPRACRTTFELPGQRRVRRALAASPPVLPAAGPAGPS